MPREQTRYRLMLVAGDSSRESWPSLLPEGWDLTVTADLEHARLAQQLQSPDLVLVSADAPGLGQPDAVARLMAGGVAPVILLADEPDAVALAAVRAGAACLPADWARRCPELLHAELERAVRPAARPRAACGDDCASRVDRLLGLLWEVTPGVAPGPWFTQRHMLERLDEEAARIRRDGGPLSVVLGEVQPAGAVTPQQAAQVREWAVHQIGRHKRRSDVAGQYGLDGFMLVLPRATPEQAGRACQRLHAVLANPPAGLPQVHVAFGTAGVPGERPNVPGLLGRAEQRLDRSRRGQRA